MNTAMTVQASANALQVYGGGGATNAMTSISGGGFQIGSITPLGGGYCYGCYHWPCTCHAHWYPTFTYSIASTDKAAILKAWLDGYMTDRKMSEKALKTIQKKLEEFTA
jgi:hypothetical protein